MKLKNFMMDVFEYLDNHPKDDETMELNLRVKYSVTPDFAKQLIKEWKRERASISVS